LIKIIRIACHEAYFSKNISIMHSIVVPVNFSANSANAARYAADTARAIGADIHLLHVFEIPVSVSEVPMPESVFQELRDAGFELLSRLQTALIERTSGKVAIFTDLETGGIEARLEAFCRVRKPLLVVMGATGDKFPAMFDGSNTTRALHRLPYPILVVPAGAQFKAIGTIIVACDKEDIDSGMPATLPFLQQLSDLLDARLEVVHVLTNGEESAAGVIQEYNIWKKEAVALAPKLHFVRQRKVEDGLTTYLKNHHADWVIVFPKSHSLLEFHRSKSKQIVDHCVIPVMSVHD
jgi:nucleotide-binding universal stress UspA family protein